MKFKVMFLTLAIYLTSCKDVRKPNFEYAPDMSHYLSYPTYSENSKLPFGSSALKPVEGTVPRGYKPFLYSNDIDGFEKAGKELKNPLPYNKDILNEGKRLYEIYCLVCHGPGGKGNGPVTKSEQFPKLPTMDLTSPMVKNLADGQIYFVITNGFGLMNSYAGMLSQDERWKIISYVRHLQNFSLKGDSTEKTREVSQNNLQREDKSANLIAIVGLLIVTFAILSLIKKSYLPLIALISLISAFYLALQIFDYFSSFGRQEGYQPEQPIMFSHKVHSGEYKIDCLYCHSGALKSKTAGIPPAELCMNCHKFITTGKITGEVEIKKISDAFLNSEPIKWIKVNFLPAHVRFNHAQHVRVGKIECQKCHGNVEEMDVVKQTYSFSMGWCLDCHRKTNIDTLNSYYSSIANEKITIADIDKLDCQTCHY